MAAFRDSIEYGQPRTDLLRARQILGELRAFRCKGRRKTAFQKFRQQSFSSHELFQGVDHPASKLKSKRRYLKETWWRSGELE